MRNSRYPILPFYHQLKVENAVTKTTSTQQKKATQVQKPWQLAVGELALKDNIVQYYNFNEPLLSGMDFNHLWLSALNIEADNLSWDGTNANGDLNHISFYDRSGFTIKE